MVVDPELFNSPQTTHDRVVSIMSHLSKMVIRCLQPVFQSSVTRLTTDTGSQAARGRSRGGPRTVQLTTDDPRPRCKHHAAPQQDGHPLSAASRPVAGLISPPAPPVPGTCSVECAGEYRAPPISRSRPPRPQARQRVKRPARRERRSSLRPRRSQHDWRLRSSRRFARTAARLQQRRARGRLISCSELGHRRRSCSRASTERRCGLCVCTT